MLQYIWSVANAMINVEMCEKQLIQLALLNIRTSSRVYFQRKSRRKYLLLLKPSKSHHMSDLVSKWRSKRLKMAFINYYPIAGSNGSWQEWSECVSSAHVNHVFRRRSRHILDTTSLSRRQLNNVHCLFTTEVQINQHISRTLMFFVKLFASHFFGSVS